jgi:hypothetical protein
LTPAFTRPRGWDSSSACRSGIFRAGKDDEKKRHGDAHSHVGEVKRVVAPVHHVGRGKDEMAGDKRPENGADGVAALREIDPHGAGLRRAQHGRVGIGDRLEEGEPARQNEKPREKRGKRPDMRGRDEPEGARGDENEPGQDSHLVTEAPGEQTRRDGHDRVADVIGERHQRRFGLADVQRILEVLVENVDHPVTETPKQEEKADQGKSERVRGSLPVAE